MHVCELANKQLFHQRLPVIVLAASYNDVSSCMIYSRYPAEQSHDGDRVIDKMMHILTGHIRQAWTMPRAMWLQHKRTSGALVHFECQNSNARFSWLSPTVGTIYPVCCHSHSHHHCHSHSNHHATLIVATLIAIIATHSHHHAMDTLTCDCVHTPCATPYPQRLTA